MSLLLADASASAAPLRNCAMAADGSTPRQLHRVQTSALLTKSVVVNGPQDAAAPFCPNTVKTSNYNPLTFIPVVLFELLNPWNKFANFYFLVVGVLQTVPAITLTDGRAGTVMPLSFVLFVDMLMKALEDFNRHRADRKTNDQPTERLRVANATWEAVRWSEVRVGDIVRVKNRDVFPADMLLLSGPADAPGVAWVNTKPLDGESDTKLREALKPAAPLLAASDDAQLATRLAALRGRLRCEEPNDKVNDFLGQLALTALESPAAVGPSNMVLRGCQLRNTASAHGVVVATGKECKINYVGAREAACCGGGGKAAPREKSGRLAAVLNVDIVYIAAALVATCMLGAFGAHLWSAYSGHHWYLEEGVRGSNAYEFVVALGSFFLLNYQFIPVSLYVSISMVNTINATFVRQDVEMYDEAADEPCQVRSQGLLDELGAITHVFSDKTGTLTSNHMEFRRCLIGSTSYGSGTTSISAALDEARSRRSSVEPAAAAPAPAAAAADGLVADGAPPPRGLCACKPTTAAYVNYEESKGSPSLLRLLAEGDGGRREAARAFVLHLALNHSVLLEESEGKVELSASSPDEQAFVAAAEHFGYEFVHRNQSKGVVGIRDALAGVTHEVELLEVFDYESSRKRMSVVVRLPVALAAGGCREVLYCKGADSALLPLLAPGHDGATLAAAEATLGEWAQLALRTLVFTQRQLPQFEEWHSRYRAAMESAEERAKHREGQPGAITALQSELERELTFQGATAIEDKLQDGVPEVLADLRLAGIKVWMLTGDKVGTAKNIATACNILPPDARVTELTDEVYPQLKKIKQQDLIQAPPHPPPRPPQRPLHPPHLPAPPLPPLSLPLPDGRAPACPLGGPSPAAQQMPKPESPTPAHTAARWHAKCAAADQRAHIPSHAHARAAHRLPPARPP